MAKAVCGARRAGPILLNVNLPDRRYSDLPGIKVTRLASESHIDTVQEGHDGKRGYYWLVRRRVAGRFHADMTDIGAVDQGYVSVTPLHIYQDGPGLREQTTLAQMPSVSSLSGTGAGDVGLNSGSGGWPSPVARS